MQDAAKCYKIYCITLGQSSSHEFGFAFKMEVTNENSYVQKNRYSNT